MKRHETDPPCAGLWFLFDATDSRSHQAARALCSTCPFIDECRALLLDTQRKSTCANGGPEGTWAGVLLKKKTPAGAAA